MKTEPLQPEPDTRIAWVTRTSDDFAISFERPDDDDEECWEVQVYPPGLIEHFRRMSVMYDSDVAKLKLELRRAEYVLSLMQEKLVALLELRRES